jgi:hypothetical protein
MALQFGVGNGQRNLSDDVRQVQHLLNERASATIVGETGICDQNTVNALARFQERELGMRPPSGRVEPNSSTWFALNAQSGPAGTTALDTAILAFESDAAAFALRFIKDGRVRANYVREAERFSAEIRDEVAQGLLTLEQGAMRAADMRDGLLKASRIDNSDLGRAISEAEKATGKTFAQLTEYYATELFGRPFAELTAAEQDGVFARIILKSGQPNLRFTRLARIGGKVGKGLVIVTIAFAVYNVATSDRPGREVVRQGVGIGAGIGGSIAGGALAGLACGPGAPVCVGIGALVGGIAFAVGADVSFTWLWE